MLLANVLQDNKNQVGGWVASKQSLVASYSHPRPPPAPLIFFFALLHLRPRFIFRYI